MSAREYLPPTATERAAEREALASTLTAAGVNASHHQLDQLQELLDRTGEANAQFNLTAIRDRPGMLVKHVFDSLSLLPHLPAPAAATAENDATPLRVADIGTGAGFPGLPLAILRPDLDFLLVDSIGKKARHVAATAHGLGLTNARVENARAEQLRRAGTFAGAFAVVTARALSSLEEFARNAGHLAAPDGRLLAMKGKVPEAELAALGRGIKDIAGGRWRVAGVMPLVVPGLVDERHLVELCRE